VTDPIDPIPLNDPQRTHFEVILASLENVVFRIESLAREAGDERRMLSHIAADLPDGFADAVAPTLASVRARLGALATAMRLETRRSSARRTIHALVTAQIVHLEDSVAARLRAYGMVDPRLTGELDPLLADLHADLNAVLSLLDRGQPASKRSGG
jgi:hypothetical protein